MFLEPGKMSMILDGQFGSTGKGLLASHIGRYYDVDMVYTNCSPNAGHTFYMSGDRYCVRQLPVITAIRKTLPTFFTAGSVIDADILLDEIEKFKIDPKWIFIHPRAAIVTEAAKEKEQHDSVLTGISSTLSGTGYALSHKTKRRPFIAANSPSLKEFVRPFDNHTIPDNIKAVMETSQGMDLSINHGLSYPHCTSRDMTVSSVLSDAGLHPYYLGKVNVCIRTYPIRVGGDSSPFYPDSKEVKWSDIGVEPEYTSVTCKERRVATFSRQQYKKMLVLLRPDNILLNFVNYLDREQLAEFWCDMPDINFFGLGPKPEQITTSQILGRTVLRGVMKNERY